MEYFTPDQWIVLVLVFLLGLFLGMAFLANPKWKRRYREESRLRQDEVRRREALETERSAWERSNADRARTQTPTDTPVTTTTTTTDRPPPLRS